MTEQVDYAELAREIKALLGPKRRVRAAHAARRRPLPLRRDGTGCSAVMLRARTYEGKEQHLALMCAFKWIRTP